MKIKILLAVILLSGCISKIDVRSELEKQVLPKPGLQQTQFAYIGKVQTPDGPVYVTIQKLIITEMLAPRGQAYLHLFDEKYNLINSYSLTNLGEPLWCEGSKIFLGGFGYAQSIPPDQELITIFQFPKGENELGYPTGNVIDFSAGMRKPVFKRERRYGSSGGVNDDPFKIKN